MSAKIEPRSGMNYGWDYGENNWNTGMDANLLFLGRFGVHLSVKDRDVTDPTTLTPSAGDTYIVGTLATGDWVGKDGQVAVWVPGTPAGSWAFSLPRLGWVAYIEDEEKLSAFKAAGWSAGVAI